MRKSVRIKAALCVLLLLAGTFCPRLSSMAAPLSSYPKPTSYPGNVPNSNDGVLDSYLSAPLPATASSDDNADDRMQSYPMRFAAFLDAVKTGIDSPSDASNILTESVARTTFTLSGYSTDSMNLTQIRTGIVTADGALDNDFEKDLGYLADGEIYDDAYFAAVNLALEMCYYAGSYREYLTNEYGSNVSDLSGLTNNQTDMANLTALNEACEKINKEFLPSGVAVPLIDEMWTQGSASSPSLKDYAEAVNANTWERLSQTVTSNREVAYDSPLSEFYTSQFEQVDLASATFDATVEGNENSIQVWLSDNIIKGIAYSATYIPMQTNVYSADTLSGYDNEWLRDFHYKYGFMRKALFKSTGARAAMDVYNTSNTMRGATEVCTLRDIIEAGEDDLVLYIDSSFYNAEDAAEQASRILDTRAEKMQASREALEAYLSILTKIQGAEKESEIEDFLDSETTELVTEMLNSEPSVNAGEVSEILRRLREASDATYRTFSWDSVLKTNGNTAYDDKLRTTITSLADMSGSYISNPAADSLVYDNLDTLCLPSSDISKYLAGTTTRIEVDESSDTDTQITTYDSYTPMLSYAYVSAIYRDAKTYALSNSSVLNAPVFISSKDLCGVQNASQYYKNSLLNYMLVRNLEAMVDVNYSYTLDMDSPVYMDIYGNILTESGVVVIPAASNATLFPSDYNTVMASMGLFAAYGKSYYVPIELSGSVDVLSSRFRQDTSQEEYWIVDGYSFQIDGYVIDFANLSAYSTGSRNAVINIVSNYLGQDTSGTHCVWPVYVNIINEVMRGAPIGYFDTDSENLVATSYTRRSAVAAAAKLESLIESLNSKISNTLFVIPDLTTMENSEYIVGFFFKLMIAAVVVVTIISIYRDAVSYSLGLHTLKQVFGSVALTFIAIAVIPAVFQLTYYTANKLLLQDEMTKIAMYNLEKEESGVEVGVTKLDQPSSTNKLMVQLDWITVPWYRQMEHMMFRNSIENISIAREEAYSTSGVARQPDVTVYNDGVYMSVNDIFASVGMDYTFLTDESVAEAEGDTAGAGEMLNGLYLYSNGTEQTLSFYSPYYVFLYALTSNVNSYNYTNDSYNYTTKLQSGNRLKTVGLSSSYFTSYTFMDDYDPLHLYEIYGITPSEKIAAPDIWSVEEKVNMRSSIWYNPLQYRDLERRISICTDYCKDFIAENRELLGKVTDETFIKVMALTMAMKYNQVFGITTANCYEIYNIDSNDLLRMCVVNEEEVMLSSPLNYARFVMTYGGEAGVYAAAVLVMVMYAGSFIKPACVMLSFIAVFVSIFVFKVVLRRKNMSLYGYVVTVALLSATNLLHAVLLKVSTYLPELGLSLFWCCIFMVLMQIAYLLVLAYVTGTALADFQNLGFDRYKDKYDHITRNKRRSPETSTAVPYHSDNHEYLNDLYKQYRERGGV